jgi:RNA polymerase-binding transcription factor DksA
MTDTDYTLIRLQLEKEFKRLNHRLESLRSNRLTGDGSDRGPFGEAEDQAAETSNLENSLAQEEQVANELAEVNAALNRFRMGTYGLCEKCGCPISTARLQALPTARLCMDDAQNKRRKSCAFPSTSGASG